MPQVKVIVDRPFLNDLSSSTLEIIDQNNTPEDPNLDVKLTLEGEDPSLLDFKRDGDTGPYELRLGDGAKSDGVVIFDQGAGQFQNVNPSGESLFVYSNSKCSFLPGSGELVVVGSGSSISTEEVRECECED